MIPSSASQHVVNGRFAHPQRASERRHVAAILMLLADHMHHVNCQATTCMPLSPGTRFWVKSRTVPVAARQQFRMQPSAVCISSCKSFRMTPGRIHVPSGHAFGMQSGGVKVARQLAALQFGVKIVGCVSTKPQVADSAVLSISDNVDAILIVSDAGWLVAGVADDQTLRRPLFCSQPPRIDMRTLVLLFNGSKLAVPVFVAEASPRPAVIADMDFGPETGFGGKLDTHRDLLTVARGVRPGATPIAHGPLAFHYTFSSEWMAAEMQTAQQNQEGMDAMAMTGAA